MTSARPKYSVVVPFYNEEEAAPALLEEILEASERLDGEVECVCVDDGSSDGTPGVVARYSADTRADVRLLQFPKNRGQASAVLRGLREARGDILVTMDGDGQNDPADIPAMVEKLADADMVCGVRVDRNDTLLRRVMSRFANAVRSRVLADGVRDSGCALRVMRREVVSALVPIKTLYSFIPAQVVAAGFRVTEIPVKHRARSGGLSSYGFAVFAIMPFIDMMGMRWYRKRCILTPSDCSVHRDEQVKG